MTAFEMLARSGYAARAAVYLIVGIFAVMAAFGSGESKGPEDAAGTLLQQPFGQVLVGLLIVGLIGYAVWRACQAILDTDDHGTGPKGIVVRIAMFVGGLLYLGLALSALALAFGIGTGGGGEGQEDLMARAIGLFGAAWTAALLAAVFLGAALAHAWKAVKASFLRFFLVDPETRRRIKPIGQVGLMARGAVFLVLAGMMAYRAMTASDAGEPPPNLAEVLEAVQAMPAGFWLLLALGVGLLFFAGYSLAAAVYRTIDRRPLANATGKAQLVAKRLSPLG